VTKTSHRVDTNSITKQALLYKPNGEETLGDGGNDGRTNFTLKVKEQALQLTFQS